MSHLRRTLMLSLCLVVVGCNAGSSAPSGPAGDPIRIGAVFPLGGSAGQLAGYELQGVRIAADAVNADGGVGGRPIQLEVRDVRSAADAAAAMASLQKEGIQVVIGAYGSDLSIAASRAADAAGLVYWEAGAVADRLTGRGLPMVFRVGATGSNLGSNSATFAAIELASRLGRATKELRVAIVAADDAYAASVADAAAAMASLQKEGIQVVIGAYGSDLSIAASTAADAAGLVYWEAGAVADRLTGRGLPMVFRVGATGSNLGSNSATFATTEIASRLGRAKDELRVAIVAADDAYATSVADAAAATSAAFAMPVVARATYSLVIPDWAGLMGELAGARPDVIILASHIPDGIAFRQAMLASGLEVGALIGSTMAECDPDFAGELGTAAIGIFASDRPTGGFQPDALGSGARAVYDRFAAAWGSPPIKDEDPGYGGDAEYTISGPAEAESAGATEEALSGFTAAWALFHVVLPAAAAAGDPDAHAITTAANQVDLPTGSLPNGAGLRFSSDPASVGQNERAAAVIWQWQAVRTYAFVWPATFATGPIGFVPLP